MRCGRWPGSKTRASTRHFSSACKPALQPSPTPPAPGTDDREIVTELASLGTRVVDVERLLDRTLFTACAAYAYARSAALGARKSDEVLTAEINAAYDRQRRLSQEQRP